jgi:hypothetical protein
MQDLEAGLELRSYATQTGKTVSDADFQALSDANDAKESCTWTAEIEARFYAAMSRIAAAVSPVVPETLGARALRGSRKAIRYYSFAAAVLTVLVLSLSCLLFVVAQASDDIEKTVKENDRIALSLHNQLQAHAIMILDAKAKKDAGERDAALLALQNAQPALLIKEQLQTFATNNRQLYADVTRIDELFNFFRIRWRANIYKNECPKGDDANAGTHPGLYWPPGAAFGLYGAEYGMTGPYDNAPKHAVTEFRWPPPVPPDWRCDPDHTREVLEITLPLLAYHHQDKDNPGPFEPPENAVEQGFQKIAVYQDIRSMAMFIHDIVLAFVGAVTGFLLPVLYACLGACASIMRNLSTDCVACVFHPEHSKVTNRSHLTTAIIVGISIGLFSDLLDGGKKISPLALAFVAGYASDKFFHFLDRLVSTVFPARASAPPMGVQGVQGAGGMGGGGGATGAGGAGGAGAGGGDLFAEQASGENTGRANGGPTEREKGS